VTYLAFTFITTEVRRTVGRKEGKEVRREEGRKAGRKERERA